MTRAAPLRTSLAFAALALTAACQRQGPAASNATTAAPAAPPPSSQAPAATNGGYPQTGVSPGGVYPPAGGSSQGGATYPPAGGMRGVGMRGGGMRPINLPLPQFQARFRARLMRADTNGDGKISLAEWTAWRASRPRQGPVDPARQFQGFDRNRDGFITPDEIDARSARVFARRSAMSARGGGAPGGAVGLGGAGAGAGEDEPQ